MKTTNSQLVAGLPAPCLKFLCYLESLLTTDVPNYAYIDSLFDQLFACSGQHPDVPYDWEKRARPSSCILPSTFDVNHAIGDIGSSNHIASEADVPLRSRRLARGLVGVPVVEGSMISPVDSIVPANPEESEEASKERMIQPHPPPPFIPPSNASISRRPTILFR
jgi:hypothetical protein